MSVSNISNQYDFASAGITSLTQPGQAATQQGAASTSAAAPQDQYQSEFSALFAAVQSGNMQDAQQALSAIQQNASPVYGPNGQSATQSPAESDMQALIGAVQGGNVSAAQQALSQLQSAFKTQGGSKHHHHHHGGGTASTAPTTSTDSTDASDTLGTTSASS